LHILCELFVQWHSIKEYENIQIKSKVLAKVGLFNITFRKKQAPTVFISLLNPAIYVNIQKNCQKYNNPVNIFNQSNFQINLNYLWCNIQLLI